MTQLFERCAVAFALDLPDGRVPATDALRALVDQHRDTAATWLPSLADELRALSLGELGEPDYAFMRQFYDDFAACQQEPDRLGIEDHFGFESRLRFVAVTAALERADGTALGATCRVPSGRRRGRLRWSRRPRASAIGSVGVTFGRQDMLARWPPRR